MSKRLGSAARGPAWSRDYSQECYSSWRQVAGYFDGDGAVYVSNRVYVLKIRIAFYDTWKPQLEAIRTFLETKGIPTRRLGLQRKRHTDLWNLTLSDHGMVKKVIHRLLPFACKKRGDLLVALNYLEDRITAKEVMVELNEQVEEKRRSGYIRSFDVPLRLSEGARAAQRRGAEAGARKIRVNIPASIAEKIRIDRYRGSTFRKLRSRYGYSERVIRRIVGA